MPSSKRISDCLDTYYLYDGRSRVTHVIPPGADLSKSSLLYAYRYDGEDQVTAKHVPDRGWTEYRYNRKGLLGAYQDPNLREQRRWYVYNFDGRGRPTVDGLYYSSSFTTGSFTNVAPSKPLNKTIYGTTTQDKDRIKTVETKILNDDPDAWLTTTNYYTPCGRLDYQEGNNHLNISARERTDYTYDGAGNVLRSTYGHRDPNQVLINVTSEHHYDFAGRAYKSFFQLGSGARTQLSELVFNLTGQVATKYQGGTGQSGTRAWLQKLDYDYLDNGMLQGINLDGLTGSTQRLPNRYQYDRNVYDPSPGVPSTSDMDAKDLFYLELYREQVPATSSYNLPARRNGDITAVATQVRGRSQQVWGMTYDSYDRMRDARFYQRNSRTTTASYTSRYRATVSYDKRGNISRLDRYGMYVYPDYWKYKQIDRLTYNYKGSGTEQTNRLHHITEGADDNLGYRERSSNYDYDANGNLRYDVQRDADIEYNHLDLPVKISYRNGTAQRHEFTYDAAGTLVTRRSYSQSGAEDYRQDYIGGLEYYDGKLNTVQHEEGRVYLGGGSQRYDYVLSDHLGNSRLLYSDLNDNGIPEVPNEIISETHYYPFGMPMTGPWMENTGAGGVSERLQYGYNGIMRPQGSGLGINMARYRTLDPITGRWWQVDPEAESFAGLTPYNSMGNSPVSLADPQGDAPLVGAAIGVVGNGIGNLFAGRNFFEGAGQAALMGMIGADISSGIGGIASSLANQGGSRLGVAAFQLGAHGLTGGALSAVQGGNFWHGAASGAFSSITATGIGALGGKGGWQVLGGTLSGGFGSAIAGGSFAEGAMQGAITSGLNHASHIIQYDLTKAHLIRLAKKAGLCTTCTHKEIGEVFEDIVEGGLDQAGLNPIRGELLRSIIGNTIPDFVIELERTSGGTHKMGGFVEVKAMRKGGRVTLSRQDSQIAKQLFAARSLWGISGFGTHTIVTTGGVRVSRTIRGLGNALGIRTAHLSATYSGRASLDNISFRLH